MGLAELAFVQMGSAELAFAQMGSAELAFVQMEFAETAKTGRLTVGEQGRAERCTGHQ